MIRLSFTNFAAATGTVTASSESSAYPAANLTTPEQPFNPARTGAGGAQWWTIDLGGAESIGAVALIRANFTSAKIQLNGSDSWGGGLLYDSGTQTIARNRINARYHHLVKPASISARYVHVVVPSQTPVDGQGVYQLGGLWVGRFSVPPRDMDLAHELERIEALRDEEPDAGGWEQRSVVGDPRALLRASRRAAAGTMPGSGDGLATWLDLELSYTDADVALVSIHENPAHVWVMRRTGAITTWKVAYPWATSELELREVIR